MALAVVLIFAAVLFHATTGLGEIAPAPQNPTRGDGEVHVLPVQGNIYMLLGAGGNITVSVGFDGTMLVDTGSEQMTDKVLAAVKQLAVMVTGSTYPPSPCVGLRCPGGAGSGAFNSWGWSSPAINTIIASPAPIKPIRYIINSSIDPDHTGGNAKIAKTGVTYTGGNVARGPGGAGDNAEVWAFETVLSRMTDGRIPEAAWPTDTYYTGAYKWNGFFNGEGIELVHVPAAHTDGDTMVYFRYSDVISAGDVFSIASYPVIDVAKGGEAFVDAAERLGDLLEILQPLDVTLQHLAASAGPRAGQRIGGIDQRRQDGLGFDLLVMCRDRIDDLIKSDMTLQQIKAVRPTLDYDGRYGSPDAFIEAVYRSLTQKR